MTRYALRHRTSGRWMASHPDMGTLKTTAEESEAISFPTHTEADLYALDTLEDFAPLWITTPVTREMLHDYLAGQSKGDGHREA